MPSSKCTIEVMRQGDLADIETLVNAAFRAILKEYMGLEPPPDAKPEGRRVVGRYHRDPELPGWVARDEGGKLRGCIFFQRSGRMATPGPVAVDPDYHGAPVGVLLMRKLLSVAREQGFHSVDGVTFPRPKHLYFNFAVTGYRLGRLVSPMAKLLAGGGSGRPGRFTCARLSSASPEARASAVSRIGAITELHAEGYDLRREIAHVLDHRLGDVFLVSDAEKLLGFAIGHHAADGEAFAYDDLLVKLLYVRPDVDTAPEAFGELMRYIEDAGREVGSKRVFTSVDMGRERCVSDLFKMGYQIQELPHVHTFVRLAPSRRTRSVLADDYVLEELR